MNVFLTGGTGYIGSAVLDALQGAGHHVFALARSEDAIAKVVARGASAIPGSLVDGTILRQAARECDGVIHTATTNDPEAPHADERAVVALLQGLEGSGKPLLYTSGVWVHGATGDAPADEATALNPAQLVAWRPAIERMVLEASSRGVRSVVIRPGVVYGRGGGMVGDLVRSARKRGGVRMVGNGRNRWALVQVDDLADLYRRALERAKPGSVYLGVHGPALPLRTIAEAAGRAAGAGAKVEEWALEQARARLGPYADALALDQTFATDKASRELGWNPKGPDLLDDLRSAAYAG